MRLPGTRYQEPGWEEVRKLLGQCSLALLRGGDGALATPAHLEDHVDGMAHQLRAQRRSARAQAPGNSYGDSVFELALTLVYELRARPADWDAFCAAVAGEAGAIVPGMGDALLRKKVNDMYAVLRDKVDADNYQVACGRPCSPNRMYAYRMLDTAYGELARLFAGWEQHREQVGAILGRALDGTPIEVRQLRSIADCRPAWLLRWSETLERHAGSPGPLHTRSKRFASLKTSPDKIGAMLREIGEYEALSANRDHDWLQERDDAAVWVEDYWRVLQQSEDAEQAEQAEQAQRTAEAAAPGPDRILEARRDELDALEAVDAEDAEEDAAAPPQPEMETETAPNPRLAAIAASVSLPPGYLLAAARAEDGASRAARALAGDALPVRLAVYARLLGPADEAYPDAWRDPASGELPTMQQLAALAEVSLPTLRKRRDAAIARLQALNGLPGKATTTKGG
jgi:hypothetical protein